MHSLSLLNVRLRACSEDWAWMTPTAQGHHCARCNRAVLNFTQSSAADLEVAFRAAPDGRVCSQFHPHQLAPDQPAPFPRRVALRPKLRRLLVALALVCGLGLSAQEAVAQVKKATPATPVTPAAPKNDPTTAGRIFVEVEQEPVFQGGREQMWKFISDNIRYPRDLTESGKVFVRFTIDAEGNQQNVRVVKGFDPYANAEALRVVSLLKSWTPGTKNGKPAAIEYNIPIMFEFSGD